MTNKEKKQLAQSLYVKSGLTKKDIAKQVGCTEKTLRSWIDKGEWNAIKEAESITRGQLLSDAYKQLNAINREIEDNHKGIPNKQLSDAKGVIRKEIEALSENPLHVYVEVFQEFTHWVLKTNPSELKNMTGMCNSFIEEKASN